MHLVSFSEFHAPAFASSFQGWDAYHLLCPHFGSLYKHTPRSFATVGTETYTKVPFFLVWANLSRWVLTMPLPEGGDNSADIPPMAGVSFSWSTSAHTVHPLIIRLPLWQATFLLFDIHWVYFPKLQRNLLSDPIWPIVSSNWMFRSLKCARGYMLRIENSYLFRVFSETPKGIPVFLSLPPHAVSDYTTDWFFCLSTHCSFWLKWPSPTSLPGKILFKT